MALTFSSGLGRRSHGSLITGPGDYRAYLPNPLPPSIKWDDFLIRSLGAEIQVVSEHYPPVGYRPIHDVPVGGSWVTRPRTSVLPPTRASVASAPTRVRGLYRR